MLSTYTGILMSYGFGQGFGAIELSISGMISTFFAGLPMKINGAIVRCSDPSFPGEYCTDWPSNMIFGKTLVTVTCWKDTTFRPGTTQIFCDEIDTGVAAAAAVRRAAALHRN
jgi:hypothetical protein